MAWIILAVQLGVLLVLAVLWCIALEWLATWMENRDEVQ